MYAVNLPNVTKDRRLLPTYVEVISSPLPPEKKTLVFINLLFYKLPFGSTENANKPTEKTAMCTIFVYNTDSKFIYIYIYIKI